MANPDPEVLPEEVMKARPDAIMATGRSDYPNQVNNVLGFPFIFRGALDTSATAINEEMKMAAVRALAQLAKEDVPESVSRAYGGQKFRFGRDYLIPKPFDRRVLLWVAPAVAEAAMKSGVARKKFDIPQYRDRLETLLGTTYTVMRGIKNRIKADGPQSGQARIVLPEGESSKILRAAHVMREEGIAEPILLGNDQIIVAKMKELGLEEGLKGVRIIRPTNSELRDAYSVRFFEKRQRKGVTHALARQLMKETNYFGAMMVEVGDADGLLSGISQGYPETIRPAIQVIGVKPGSRLAGIYMMIFRNRVLWFADTTVNIDPTAEELADIAIQTAWVAKSFSPEEPRVAMLSFSNFGSNTHPNAAKVREAVGIVKKRMPNLVIDGEMQADVAVTPNLSKESFPFNLVPGDANILIFPDLQSGNIAYKLMARLGNAEAIGPILVGLNKPVFVLQQGSDVNDVVNMAAITAMEVQLRKKGESHVTQ
jgi:malate dehydrogenase (oxaloacetate-decarboxylating)(NADP+)